MADVTSLILDDRDASRRAFTELDEREPNLGKLADQGVSLAHLLPGPNRLGGGRYSFGHEDLHVRLVGGDDAPAADKQQQDQLRVATEDERDGAVST